MPVTDSIARTRRLRRRRFLLGAAILGVAGGGLLGYRALQPARAPRLGILAVGSRAGRAHLIEGLLQGLRELGYVDGQNLSIEYRFSEGRDERLPELAAELIALPVDLIVASGTPAAFAAKRATSTASLARPGGNLTGMTLLGSQLAGKRLELLKETLPGLSRVAVFCNPTNPTYGPGLSELEAAAPRLDLELQRVEIRAPEDFAGAFEAAVSRRAGALIGPGDPLTTNHPKLVADLGLGFRMPTLMDLREFVEAGCLLSLGANVVESYRRAAAHVDKILRGTRPGHLPMEQPTKLDVSVNLGTARALGLTIPPSVLMQVTEVIQ